MRLGNVNPAAGNDQGPLGIGKQCGGLGDTGRVSEAAVERIVSQPCLATGCLGRRFAEKIVGKQEDRRPGPGRSPPR